MNHYKVYVTDNRHGNYQIEREMLSEIGAELVICDCITEEDVISNCFDADGILLDMAPVTAKVVDTLVHCKVINRYGVGVDNLDVDACTKKGIQVTYVPDYCMEDVSDHALALLMSCLRNVAFRDRMIRQGQWNIQSAYSFRLAGKTLGIIGAGRIARTLVRKTKGFSFKEILAYDPYVSKMEMESMGMHKVELEELLKMSDFVSLHLPANPETVGIINQKTLSLMKKNAILINVSRGSLVDDEALICALKTGQIAAAGLDTHRSEPLSQNSAYFLLDNVVLTDHTAYNTKESIIELKKKSTQNVIDVLTNKVPLYPVNHLWQQQDSQNTVSGAFCEICSVR